MFYLYETLDSFFRIRTNIVVLVLMFYSEEGRSLNGNFPYLSETPLHQFIILFFIYEFIIFIITIYLIMINIPLYVCKYTKVYFEHGYQQNTRFYLPINVFAP